MAPAALYMRELIHTEDYDDDPRVREIDKFTDAFMSLSWHVPQIGHCQYLSDSFSSLCLYPQTLQSFDDGYIPDI